MPQELLDDVLTLKPHLFVSVPRLWNRIYDRVMATIRQSNPVSRKLFETAYASKKAAMEAGGWWGVVVGVRGFSSQGLWSTLHVVILRVRGSVCAP